MHKTHTPVRARQTCQTPSDRFHARLRRSVRAARVIVVALLLCACSGSRTNALKRIQAAGTLRVAMDPSFPPFEFVDGAGQIAGLDAELAQAIAARLGVEAHFVTTGYDALYDALTVGRADVIISALYPDPARMQAFVFSPSYFNAGEVLIVREDSPITGVSDLAGKQVALVFGTEAHMVALQWEKTMPTPPILMTGDAPETITSVLAAGIVDAVILDNVTAQMTLANTPGLRVLTPLVTDEPYTVAARKEDTKLVEAIGTIIEDMQANGELEALTRRWMQ